MKEKSTLADAMRTTAQPRTAAVAPSRRGKKAMVIYLEPDVSKRLKVLAAQNEKSVHELGLEAIDLLFERHDEGEGA